MTSTGVPKPTAAPKQAPPPPAPDELDKLTQARLLALAAPVTLPADPAELTAEHVPRPQSLLEQLLSASRMRASIADNKPVHTCACCGMCTGLASLQHQHLPLEQLPNLALLRADEPATPELPRHGLTHVEHEGVKYCITPDGLSSAQGEPVTVRVCKQCHDDLARKKVPKFGYPRVDTGPWPKDECGALPELTYVESLLLAPAIPMKHVITLRPTGWRGRVGGVRKKQLTGQAVVVPGSPIEHLSTLLPRDFRELPEHLTVRLLRVHLRRGAATPNPRPCW